MSEQALFISRRTKYLKSKVLLDVIKVIHCVLCSYLISKKMNERITNS